MPAHTSQSHMSQAGWLLARPLRPAVLLAAGSSLMLNLSLLVPALFTMQVFDRVFASRSIETLVMLSALVVIALALAWAMDLTRARALETAGATLSQVLWPLALHRMLDKRASAQHGVREPADALRDVAILRNYMDGGVAVLFDAPWLPLYLGTILLMSVPLGLAAAAGALALIALGALTNRLTRAQAEAVQQHARIAQHGTAALLRRAEAIVGMGGSAHAVKRAAHQQTQLAEAQHVLSSRSAALATSARLLQQSLQAGLLATAPGW